VVNVVNSNHNHDDEWNKDFSNIDDVVVSLKDATHYDTRLSTDRGSLLTTDFNRERFRPPVTIPLASPMMELPR
jgi:hypothetical protein